MRPVDCPFRAADRVLERIGAAARVILVDVHAEATSDKQLLGRYLDGRVSAVLGTHTHVATADEQILPGGTAYQTDVGMTGPYDSILGRRYDRVLAATLTFVPHPFDVATGDPRLCGALVEVDPATGRALAIRRVRIDQDEARRLMIREWHRTEDARQLPSTAGPEAHRAGTSVRSQSCRSLSPQSSVWATAEIRRSRPRSRPRATAEGSSKVRPSTKCQRTQRPAPSRAAERSKGPIRAASASSRGRIAA